MSPEVEGEPVESPGMEVPGGDMPTEEGPPMDNEPPAEGEPIEGGIPEEEDEDEERYDKLMEAVFKQVASRIKLKVTKDNMDVMVQKLSERIFADLRGKK
jgi:hypothetical protein